MILGGTLGVILGLFILFNINRALNSHESRVEELEEQISILKGNLDSRTERIDKNLEKLNLIIRKVKTRP